MSAAAQDVTVLQYNTLYTNDDIEGIAQEIVNSQAEVVAVHEMTEQRWSELAPMIAALYPYNVHRLEHGSTDVRGFASVLVSRSPLHLVTLDETDAVPVAATTTVHGRELLTIALHPSPSRTDATKINQRRDLLESSQRLVAAHDGPAVVITDLNIAPTSPDYRDFLVGLGWPDPRRQLGITPTFPAGSLNPFGIAIDHVFASPELQVIDYELSLIHI